MNFFLLLLSAAVSAVLGQQTLFSASRGNVFNLNLLTLRCEDEIGAISDPVFFKDGEPAINVQPIPGGVSLYEISQSMEGIYSCGTVALGVSSNTHLLVG